MLESHKDRRLAAMERRTPAPCALAGVGAAVLVLLASCGGGGDGQHAPLPPYPGDAAINAYYQASHHLALSATDAAGHTDTLQIDQVPSGTPVNFHGVSAYRMDDTRTLQVDGVATGGSESRQYFLLNPYVPVGSEYGGFTNCFICLVFEFAQVTSSFPLPSSLAAGDSGPFANMTYYNGEGGRDPPGTIVFGYGTTNYSVTADTATTKRVCLALGITNVTSAGANLADSAETDCYTVDVGGTALLVSVTMIWNKETLTFQ